jgi:hypothetical protein
MNNSFDRLIDGMCATLRSEVLTRLDDEFARGQVFGVINLLNTFKARADWSPGFLVQQLQAQAHALDQVRESLRGVPQAPSVPLLDVPAPVTADVLITLRDEGNRAICELLTWLSSHRDALASESSQAIEQALRQSMRSEIEIELKNSPRPLFAEMSSGKES